MAEALDSRLALEKFVGGTVGGVLQAIVAHPIDTVKTLVQVRGFTVSQSIREIRSKQGFRGFYNGVTPGLMLNGSYNALLFGVNQVMRNVVRPPGLAPGEALPFSRVVLSSWLTAPVYVLFITPAELVKVRLQNDRATARNPVNCVRLIVRESGVSGLLRGYGTTVASRLVGLPFYFGSYDAVRVALTPPGQNPAWWVPMLGGVAAGVCFWSANYPLDFIKTNVQSGTMSPVAFARKTFAAGGIRAFYRGFGVCIARAIPANSAVWFGIEQTTQFMRKNGW